MASTENTSDTSCYLANYSGHNYMDHLALVTERTFQSASFNAVWRVHAVWRASCGIVLLCLGLKMFP